ncbi:MAG: hypothetical protein JWP97_5413 [Labilithrix sp.]|nr:hypothetical protein [Labilithrix sp.]
MGKRWTVPEFAAFALGEDDAAAQRRARRLLRDLDRRHAGRLLADRPRGRLTVSVARLRRLWPDLFGDVPSIEWRVEALEQNVAQLRVEQTRTAKQVQQLARDAAKLRTPEPARAVRYVWPSEERAAAE